MNPVKMSPVKNIKGNDINLLDILMSRFIPYWPILVFFLTVCFIAAIAYLRFASPAYEATATILVKDENKGYEDSQVMESLNIFGTKKIVENEIEVIHSRVLMKEVVNNLRLYAPVYREGSLKSTSAYTTSPILIEVKEPEKISLEKEKGKEKIYFTYESVNNLVKINGKTYSLDEWHETEFGGLKFILNSQGKISGTDPLYFMLIPPKVVVSNTLKGLNVAAVNKLSSVVSLQFIDEVPERAEDILNELINAYDRAGINDKSALANNTLEFVDERLKHVKQALDSVEKQIQTFRSEAGVFNLSEQSSLFLKNVGENDQQVGVLDMQLSVLEQIQKYLSSGKTKSTIVPSNLDVDDPLLTQLLQRLYEAELEYEKLKYTTAENNPIMTSLSNEIQRIKPLIMENIRVQKINLTAKRNQLNQTSKSYSNTLTSIPEKERMLLEISREKTIINNVYNFLLQKREETALSNASTVSDSRILDVAESSIKPVSPKKIVAFPAALVIAFILTLMVVTYKDYISSTIIFRSEIETLTNIPVLGELANLKTDKNYLPEISRQEYVMQQIYHIIASKGLYSKHNSKKKILITSSVQGEGKSFISMNLAFTLASSGKKVILVDLDLKNPSVSQAITSSNGPGVAEYLLGEKEAHELIHTTEHPNLYLLKAGELQSNSTALITGSDRLEHLFSYLEHSFDFIVIDTAPIDPVSDAIILSQYSDTTLYVVRHRVTPKSILELLDHRQNIKSMGDLGIVFNGVKPRGFVKGYGYGYASEYEYKQTPTKIYLKKEQKELVEQV